LSKTDADPTISRKYSPDKYVTQTFECHKETNVAYNADGTTTTTTPVFSNSTSYHPHPDTSNSGFDNHPTTSEGFYNGSLLKNYSLITPANFKNGILTAFGFPLGSFETANKLPTTITAATNTLRNGMSGANVKTLTTQAAWLTSSDAKKTDTLAKITMPAAVEMSSSAQDSYVSSASGIAARIAALNAAAAVSASTLNAAAVDEALTSTDESVTSTVDVVTSAVLVESDAVSTNAVKAATESETTNTFSITDLVAIPAELLGNGLQIVVNAQIQKEIQRQLDAGVNPKNISIAASFKIKIPIGTISGIPVYVEVNLNNITVKVVAGTTNRFNITWSIKTTITLGGIYIADNDVMNLINLALNAAADTISEMGKGLRKITNGLIQSAKDTFDPHYDLQQILNEYKGAPQISTPDKLNESTVGSVGLTLKFNNDVIAGYSVTWNTKEKDSNGKTALKFGHLPSLETLSSNVLQAVDNIKKQLSSLEVSSHLGQSMKDILNNISSAITGEFTIDVKYYGTWVLH
jgi:hypothetical protein